jgi:hypothetical protein
MTDNVLKELDSKAAEAVARSTLPNRLEINYSPSPHQQPLADIIRGNELGAAIDDIH